MDVNIILSIINTKLRDIYQTLDELLDDLDNGIEMVEFLTSNGYKYDEKINQFK